MAANITLSVDEDVLSRARAIAHKRGTSVNALVREHLTTLARETDEERRSYHQALSELREMSRKSNARLGPDYKFDRNELYADRLR